jgi:succinate dehydrogenase/fumarate reductase flavoprotein subunit
VEEFGYIVVGAGTAGCEVAARLSQDPAARVLLPKAERHPVAAAFARALAEAGCPATDDLSDACRGWGGISRIIRW